MLDNFIQKVKFLQIREWYTDRMHLCNFTQNVEFAN